jgi:SAM-dependent methyltransferase
MDIDEVQLRFGRSEAAKQNITNCSFVCGDFTKMAIVPDSYDLILMCAVHGYLDISMEVLGDKLTTLLRPGGLLYIESHPPVYMGEPERYWNPLMARLAFPSFLKIHEQKVQDRGNTRQFVTFVKPAPKDEFQIGEEGMASTVYSIPGYYYAVKRYKPLDYQKSLRNIGGHWTISLTMLQRLQYYPFIPRLYHIDTEAHAIYMEYCGVRLAQDNLPQDWEQQAKEIDRSVKACRMAHNDVMIKNILVKEGRIYLIDWGLATSRLDTPRNSVYTCIKRFLAGDHTV